MLKWINNKNRKMIMVGMIIIIFIAGFLDIKYEGLFYQLLPVSLQTFLTDVLYF
ncbi:hypothetical protein SM124_14000 [Bacillus sp. 31A1R]|uniref:Uncharacterized protein n=1 Tax=Robertmurraya mangrovi TaxID=3098077 RepID=A0ABU5J0D0_9BACI|nr:hypothetical protein [Bacillus sp. 31A1R]MDZ5472841.1 hypothetical protein [Bacillus sp. 31A1R]